MTHTCLLLTALGLTTLKVVDMTLLSNKKITVTLHDYQKTWNEAQSVCEAIGGNLYVEDSMERAIILERFKSSSYWSVRAHVWVGLHYPAIATSSIFGWTSCEWQNTDIFNHWLPSEPKDSTTMKCGLSDKTGGNWITANCDNTELFICEITSTEDCSFIHSTGEPPVTTGVDTVTITTPDDDMCRLECLHRIYDNTKNCWAVNYYSSNTIDNCILYFMDDPYQFENAAMSTSGVVFSTKDCYSDALDSTDDTAIGANTDPVPTQVCSSYTLQTTTSTASSPTISTTTSAPTTTSTTSPPTTLTPTTSTTKLTHSTTTTVTTNQMTSEVPTQETTTTNVPATAVEHSTATTQVTTSAQNTEIQTSTVTTERYTTTTLASTSLTLKPSSQSTSSTASSSVTSSPNTLTSVTSSVSPTQTTQTQTTTTSSAKCQCKCLDLSKYISNNSDIFANLTLDEKVQELIVRLRVDKTTLSSDRRKKASAEDNRTTSKSVGYAGIAFLVVVFGSVVISDGLKFIRFMTHRHDENNVHVE